MAYATESAGTQVKAVTAISAIESFDTLIARLEDLVGRASSAADKIVGVRPSPVGDAEKTVSPQSLISQIQYRRDRLMRAVDHMEGELNRVEGGLS